VSNVSDEHNPEYTCFTLNILSMDLRSWMIRFNQPYVSQHARDKLLEVLFAPKLSGNGPYSAEAEAQLELRFGGKKHFLVPSCTHALEMACRAIGLKEGDEVIVPSFTFTSTANCVALTGATLVFSDVNASTLSLDLESIKRNITSKTRAVIVVHYGGISSDIKEIANLCKESGIYLIEDNAHGLGGQFEGSNLGTFGDLSTASFHDTKNLQTGEGGSLAVNNLELMESIEVLREKGTNRSQFFRGAVDKYTWQSVGSSWIQSDILAGFLLGQLVDFEKTQARRHQIWNCYREGLEIWATQNNLRIPIVPNSISHPAHLFYLIFNSLGDRTNYISHMEKRGINVAFHYQSLHSSPAGSIYGKFTDSMKITNQVSDCLVRLPLWPDLTNLEVEKVIQASIDFKIS